MPTFISIDNSTNTKFIRINMNDLAVSSGYEFMDYEKNSIRNIKMGINNSYIEIVMYDNSLILITNIAQYVVDCGYYPVSSINASVKSTNLELYDSILALL